MNVKVSALAKSETRYITAVPLDYALLGHKHHQLESIVLCDTPGFGDTAGPEVDIANGIGIINAIKGSKSVRPVILVS